MLNELRGTEQRDDARFETDQTTELIAADGATHRVALLNISRGGGQVALSQAVAQLLSAVPGMGLGFRTWLPGDAEDDPLAGQATVAYALPPDERGEARLGLTFAELAPPVRERLDAFIATCLLYAE